MPTSTRPVLKLIVPGFMQSIGAAPDRMPALERLLAYGSPIEKSATSRSHETWQSELIDALGIGDVSRYPSSPVSWVGAGGTRSAGSWLHVDPVRMELSADGMTMHAASAWSSERVKEIATLFRTHLATTELRLCEIEDRLFAHAATGLDVDTASIQYAVSQPPRAALPTGRDSAAIRRVMTELQMLLHDRFQEADTATELKSNAVWLWGAGGIPDDQHRLLPHIWTNEHFARGVYMLHEQADRCARLPATAGGVFEQDTLESVVIVRGRCAASFDAQLFSPALDSLHRGRFARIDLFLDGCAVRIRPTYWRRLFARTQPLVELLR